MKRLVEIEETVYSNLEKVAAENGCATVEELLTKFAENFSTGCSVTLRAKTEAA